MLHACCYCSAPIKLLDAVHKGRYSGELYYLLSIMVSLPREKIKLIDGLGHG